MCFGVDWMCIRTEVEVEERRWWVKKVEGKNVCRFLGADVVRRGVSFS